MQYGYSVLYVQHHVPGCADWHAGAVASMHVVEKTCVAHAAPLQQSRIDPLLVHVKPALQERAWTGRVRWPPGQLARGYLTRLPGTLAGSRCSARPKMGAWIGRRDRGTEDLRVGPAM